MNKTKRTYVLLLIACASFIVIQVRKIKSDTFTNLHNTGWNVACLKSGKDLQGSDQRLQGFYDIAYTPAEGGRCYFSFTYDQGKVKFANPRIASHIPAYKNGPNLDTFLSYDQTGKEGKAAYFIDNTYTELISILKQPTKISRDVFGGIVVNSVQIVKEILTIAE